MTFDEFIAEIDRLGIRFHRNAKGEIRNSNDYCPIVSVYFHRQKELGEAIDFRYAGYSSAYVNTNFRSFGYYLGLDNETIDLIVNAADKMYPSECTCSACQRPDNNYMRIALLERTDLDNDIAQQS